MYRLVTSVVFACGVLALAGCQQSSGSTATTTTTETSTTSTAPAATTTATDATATAPATTTASATPMPAQCEAYLSRVQQCVDRLGTSSPAAPMVRQQLETTRQQWSQISDQAALAQACTQADASWTQSSAAMGC